MRHLTETSHQSDCVLRSINEKFISSTNRTAINFLSRRDRQLTDWTSHGSFCGLISFCVIGQLLEECDTTAPVRGWRDDRDVVMAGGEQGQVAPHDMFGV